MGDELGLSGVTQAKARFDALSYFYIGFATLWTVCVVSVSAFLVMNRSSPVLRRRGTLTSIVAMLFLHLYWTSVQLAYTLGPLYPGDTQYWIMATWFPIGISLFHGNNARFLHIAEKQRKLMERHAGSVDALSERNTRWKRLNYTKKLFISVAIGMVIQFFFSALFYVISRKWHATWGIPGTEVYGNDMEVKVQQGTGWEWVPSTLWQFIWAWIVAPYVLWKSRGIHDTQGWRFQTVGCCLASLHATPMWLIALYVPAMEKINTYWIPPQWIAVSIMMIEVLTLFLPCFQVLRQRTLECETLDSIAQWEKKNKHKNNNSTSRSHVTHRTTASTMVESMLSGFRSTSEESAKALPSYEGILTMAALEHVLERRPEPLQQFAALRDFSGENIAFLTTLAKWRNSVPAHIRFPRRNSETEVIDPQEFIRDRFVRALRIYVDFISDSHAELQVNLASNETRKLDAVFGPSARLVYGERRTSYSIAPFDTPAAYSKPSLLVSNREIDADAISSNGSEKMIIAETNITTVGTGVFSGEVPPDFDERIFDEAEKSIKYLVLTNTWPKFVKDRRTSMDSFESLDSGNSVLQMLRERYRGATMMM